ncbi:MAG: hypothetical protein K9G76_05805 [Bacteroidales bacterium]|nr:hypothetical protein [Bacteroidales bacterium]MCF8402458.1 hypothetical protein [Bacteroidales bacterium]
MKLIHVVLLLIFSVLILRSDPYQISELQQENKKKMKEKTEIISTNPMGKGTGLEIHFIKGEGHNYPSFAIWVEDMDGKYIQTLYVSQSVAKGIFNYGDNSDGEWKQGEVRRPASLPYWANKRGVKEADGLVVPTPEHPVPDAYTGATPHYNFILQTKLDEKEPQIFNVLLELNQPWDWNENWTNNKFPGDKEYLSSAQPAVVYQATIDPGTGQSEFPMQVIGHSHFAGADGSLNTDLTTLTTALTIGEKIVVKIIK